jgi:hypothetical protein
MLSVTSWQTFVLRQQTADKSEASAFIEAVWFSVMGMWIIVVSVTIGSWHKILPLYNAFGIRTVSNSGCPDLESSVQSQGVLRFQNW